MLLLLQLLLYFLRVLPSRHVLSHHVPHCTPLSLGGSGTTRTRGPSFLSAAGSTITHIALIQQITHPLNTRITHALSTDITHPLNTGITHALSTFNTPSQH